MMIIHKSFRFVKFSKMSGYRYYELEKKMDAAWLRAKEKAADAKRQLQDLYNYVMASDMTTKRLRQKLTLLMMRQKGRTMMTCFMGLCLYSLLWGSPIRLNTTESIAPIAQMPQFPQVPVTVLPQKTEPPRRQTGYTSMVKNFRYNHRRGHIINQCIDKHGLNWTSSLEGVPQFPVQPIINIKNKFMYCPVGNVGASFFIRYAISAAQPIMKSPYTIAIKDASRTRCENLAQLGTGQEEFLNSAVKVVFGRNPFSRIFSAYINRLYSPNPYYWRHWGKAALDLANMKAMGACASGVSFKQFVNLVVNKLVKDDVHLRPVFEECRMCDVMYDIVGTLETSSNDLLAWGKAINVSHSFLMQESYPFDAAMDTIMGDVESPFSWKMEVKACMKLDQMGMRIWRKLQIRGVIDSRISYPFKYGEIDDMSSQTFIAACRRAIDSSNDKDQLKKQKKQALMEAYSSLPLERIYDIARVYADDFTAFDYDPAPSYLISERKKVQDTNFLNWRVDWQLGLV